MTTLIPLFDYSNQLDKIIGNGHPLNQLPMRELFSIHRAYDMRDSSRMPGNSRSKNSTLSRALDHS
jgi:hypothetical protein